ncbi:MAG: EpsG family protein [Bacteroidales bacterium]|nr:EpsG family protein [Bacteroidales bacterium]
MYKLNRINNGTELLFTILCPFIAIPILLYGIYKQRYKDLILLALCMSIIAMAFPPFADLYRHTLDYINFKNINDSFWIHTNGKDYIFYTISYTFAKLDIPFEFVRGIFTLLCYLISFFLFKKVVSYDYFQRQSPKTVFLVFLCFYLSVPFIWIVNGIRLATAAYLLVLSWLYIYEKRYLKGIILYVLAVLLHFASVLYIPILLITIKPIKLNNVTFITLIMLFAILGPILISSIPNEFLIFFSGEGSVNLYINNSYEMFSNRLSFNGLIAMYLERMPLIYLLFYCFRNNTKNRNEVYLIKTMLLLAIIYHPFLILFQKYCLMIIPVAIYLFFSNVDCITIGKIRMMTICCFILFLSYIYGYREPIYNIDFIKLFLPVFYTFFTYDTLDAIKKVVSK